MVATVVNYGRLKTEITLAAVRAINGLLYVGEERALRDVPVRKVFSGGRQHVRFKTAAEIERDAPLRARLGLAPEILATPEAVARVRSAGRNPLKSLITKKGEFGFARTVELPSRSRSVDRTGRTPAERGRTRISGNRANVFAPHGDETARIVNPRNEKQLRYESESELSGRGRYELRSGRAVHQRRVVVSADVNARTGDVKDLNYGFTGPAYLGGGLRSTIRVEEARADQFPNLVGSLIAGDREHDYAIHQEMGNRHNPAHPFLRPRLPEWREQLPVALRRSLGRTGR